MNVLILAAGQTQSASPYPIWLSEIDGRLAIERLVESLKLVNEPNFVFAVRGRDIDGVHVDAILRQIAPTASVVDIRHDTAGAACTALLTIDEIHQDQELIVASATDLLDVDFQTAITEFRNRGATAGLFTFDSLHPRYSFVRTDPDGWVLEAAEKRPISRQANAGLYWYSRASDFFDSLKQMILKDANVGGVFFLSPALNELILQGKRITTWPLGADQYHPLKESRHVEGFTSPHELRHSHAS